MRLRSVSKLLLAAVLAVSASCDGESPTEPGAEIVAGVYVLESVSGRGPADGTVTLGADGQAQRQVRYAGNPNLFVMVGSWQIDDGEIAFALQESPVQSFMWFVRGEWRGTGFTFRHPDPADGPDIVETYRRN